MVFSLKSREEVLVTNTRLPSFLEKEKGITEVIDRVIIRFESDRPHTFIDQVFVHENGDVTENIIA